MSIPDKVQIGPHSLPITQEQADYNAKAASDQTTCWGWIEYGKGRIIINPDQCESHKRVALLHEVLHGVLDLADQRHENEEDIIRQLAAPLLDTLQRNPALVSYLIGLDEIANAPSNVSGWSTGGRD